MGRLALFLLQAFFVFSILPARCAVQVLGTTSTQAVIVYDAAGKDACTVEISESSALSPLVPDVDPALFAGANQDTRLGVVSNGARRIFVAGKHGMNANSLSNLFVGSDGKRHSRALQAGTQHFYRIACSGTVSMGSFTTADNPPGGTYGEPLPVDGTRPGMYNWPDLNPADRKESVIDPATGALIRKINIDSDVTPYRTDWTDAGSFSLCSHVPLMSGGATYYLCYVPTTYAGILVSINTNTGEALPLTSLIVPWQSMGNDARLACSVSVVFDGTAGTQFYCLQGVSGKASILLGEWTGLIDTASKSISQENPNPHLKWTNLTPSPNDLSALLGRYDPLYTPAQQHSVPYFLMTGQQKGKLLLRLIANQDAAGWIIMFDPGSKQPIGSGGTGGISAALPVWTSSASRWCGLHSVIGSGDNSPWVSAVLNHLAVPSAYLGGPYRVSVKGPSGGSVGISDTVLQIQGVNGSYEPLAQTNQKEPNGYLMDAQPGDLFFLDGNGNGYFDYSGDEYVELVSKDPINHTWTVRRANQMAASPFYAGTGLSLWTRTAIAVPAGAYLYAACRTQSLSIQANATLWWNFETDPHGRANRAPAVDGRVSPLVIEHSHTGAHTVSRDERDVMADTNCFSSWNTCWVSWTQTGGVPGLFTLGSPVHINAAPLFEGSPLPGGPNVYQQHPSYEQVNAKPEETNWFLDRMPLVAAQGAYGVSKLVAGTTTVYKVSGTVLHRDRVSTLATCGTGILRDVSSPATGLQISDNTPYAYCVAQRADECRAGSSAGDVFVSCPGANYRSAGDLATTIRCSNWTLYSGQVDICLGDVWPYAQSVVQGGFSSSMSNGELNRVITQGFARYHEPGSEYDNSIATPDGRWAMFYSTLAGSGLGYLAKIPPQPVGYSSTRRDGFLPINVNLVPPTGLTNANNAVVEFGYLENGSVTDYFCTSRREACVKGNQAGKAYAFAGDAPSGQPCESGCSISVPLIPGRVAYFQAKYRDAANRELAAGESGVITESGAAALAKVTPAAPGTGLSLATNKPTTQSSTGYGGMAGRAVDGNTNGLFSGGSVTHTEQDANAWWQVDLGTPAEISSIVIWGRTDCCFDRLNSYWVFVSDTPFNASDTPATLQYRAGTWSSHQSTAPNPSSTILTSGVQGRYVRLQLASVNYLSIAEVQVFGAAVAAGGTNLAANKNASQAGGTGYAPASYAVDTNTDGRFMAGSVSHTGYAANPWWDVDLGASAVVNSIAIWNRTDSCGDRLSDYWVFVSDTPFGAAETPATLKSRAGTWSNHQTTAPNPSTTISVGGAHGRYVRVQLTGTDYLSLAEVQVFGAAVTQTETNLALNRPAMQMGGAGYAPAGNAVDNNWNGQFTSGSVTHTAYAANAWWQVDLGATATIASVAIWNRTDCCGDRLNDYWVFISSTPFSASDTPATLQSRVGTWSGHQTAEPSPSTTIPIGGVPGRYVRVQLAGSNYLSLAEVQIFGN